MTTSMPTASPTRTIGSLGPLKRDRERAPDDIFYLTAAEWNQAADELIATCDAVLQLKGAGATGTLQGVYNNGAVSPTVLTLDSVRGRVIVRDSTPNQAGVLFGVQNDGGGNEYGFTATGLRLANIQTAIQSAAGTAIRASSGGDEAVSEAYQLDTASSYNSGTKAILSLASSGIKQFRFWGGAAPRLDFSDGTNTAGISLAAADRLHIDAGLSARYIRGGTQTVAWGSSLVINAALGEVATVTMTGNTTSVAITNLGAGQRLTIKFIQDGTGGRTVAGWSGVNLHGPFSLTPYAAAVDVLRLIGDGTSAYEIGRQQKEPPERQIGQIADFGGSLTLYARESPHTQYVTGALTGAATVNLSRTGAQLGDEIEFWFDEAGVATTVANTLTLQENGGGALALWNQNKTLTGFVRCRFTGLLWIVNTGGAKYA